MSEQPCPYCGLQGWSGRDNCCRAAQIAKERDEARKELDRIKVEFAHFTECELATLERYRCLKGASKSETQRHEKIAKDMVQTCRLYQVKPGDAWSPRGGTPRLREKLGL